VENQYSKSKKSTKLCLIIGTFAILFLSLLSFVSSNLFPMTSAQVQEWPQISFGQFYSVQYPPDWKADASRDVRLTAPDGFEMIIGVDLPVGDDSYPLPNTPMNSIAQKQIQFMSQIGFKYVTSNSMGNSANPIIKNVYQWDNETYFIEYLAKRSSGILTKYIVGGTLDQIRNYGPITARIFQNVQFSPAWEAEVRGMLDSIQQSILNTYGVAGDAFAGMAASFAETADQVEKINRQKICESRGSPPGTTVC
jgi:hypothetical protein